MIHNKKSQLVLRLHKTQKTNKQQVQERELKYKVSYTSQKKISFEDLPFEHLEPFRFLQTKKGSTFDYTDISKINFCNETTEDCRLKGLKTKNDLKIKKVRTKLRRTERETGP